MDARRRVRISTLAALLALWAGPAMARSDGAGAASQTARLLSSTTVIRGLHSGYDHPTLVAAQSSCQWQAAMAVLAANGALAAGPEPEPPGVDWTKQTAVVVAMGMVPYGYDLDILNVRQIAGVLLLDVHVDYQTNENNYEDDNPVMVLLVDGQGVNAVQATYDLALPSLLPQAAVVPCGVTRSAFRLSRTAAGASAVPSLPVTWGSIKSAYR
jgi:hypothetical protein